jgi:DNA/RNA endonuclease YhcR with UshA esterase domain
MNILKISLITSILGIVLLALLVNFSDKEITSISDLKIGQIARISGMVTSFYSSKKGHIFLKVADNTGEIDVVVFNNYEEIEKVRELEIGDEVDVIGRVEEYKGRKEIIPREIRKI